jgi:periplasmic copper chaperone A
VPTRVVVLLLLAVAIAPPAALAHSHKKKGVEVVHPWTPATPDEGGGTTRVFMKIKNLAGSPERLVAASTPAATKVELQEPGGDGAVAFGKPLAAVVIATGKETELTRKGPHLVLTGIKSRLNAYDSFKLTLVFEKAGRMVVDVAVEEPDTEEPHKH